VQKFGISNAVFLQLLENLRKKELNFLKMKDYSHAIVNVDPENQLRMENHLDTFLVLS